MKHLYTRYSIFSIFSLCLIFAFSVSAQEDTLNTPPQEGSATQEQQRTRTERRAEFTEGMHNRVINLSRNVAGRFGSALIRMTNIMYRIETRITKLKALGIDTALAETKLAEAKTALNNTEMSISSFVSAQNELSGDNTQEVFKTMQTYVRSGRESLVLTHTLLKETVSLLKQAVQNTDGMSGVSPAVSNGTESTTTVLE